MIRNATRIRPRIVMQREAIRAKPRRQRDTNRNTREAILSRTIGCRELCLIASTGTSAAVKGIAGGGPILAGSLTAAYAFVNGALTRGIHARGRLALFCATGVAPIGPAKRGK